MNILFIDAIFMVGLVMFLIGGTLFIIRQNVFSRTFQNFKKLLKHSSKIESYVEEFDNKPNRYKTVKRNLGIEYFILTVGFLCISMSAFLALI